MQLQRNYTLPNCTLTLEGMSDPSQGLTPGAPMTILVNAICQFLGQNQPLSGGSEFFNSLVSTANSYAQEQLSGIRSQLSQQGLVQMQRLENGLHEVSVYAEDQTDGEPTQRETLSTVQLFDLVEAIDQFLVDGTALPEMKLAIAPLSKQDVPSQLPLAQRAAGPVLGATGLAIAAAALFALPAPEITRPVDSEGNPIEAVSGDKKGSEGEGKTAVGGSSGEDDLAVPDNLITDEIVIGAIQADLQNQLDSAWNESLGTTEDLSYRVTTGEDGTVLGYEPLDEVSREYESKTPLLNELYTPAEGGSVEDQPLAQFKVSFIGDSTLEVEPFTVDDLNGSILNGESETLSDTSSSEDDLEVEAKEAIENADQAQLEADNEAENLEETVIEVSAADVDVAEVALEEEGEIEEAFGDEAANDEAANNEASSDNAGSLVDAERLSSDQVGDLTVTLYNAIDQTWNEPPSFDGALEYRVQVNPEGEVVGFEALTADGRNFVDDIPLGELNISAQPSQVADFKVRFESSGVLEVSPWDGF